MKDIVVLAGTTAWSVLSLCKSAVEHGAKAYCVCVGLSRTMDYSRNKYVTESYNVELDNLQKFWEDFFYWHQFQEKPILFTVYDGVCLLVDENRGFYESHFDLCLPSSPIVRAFNDKSLAGDVASANGMTVPKTIHIKEASQIDVVCQSFSFPVIVKPTTAKEHGILKFKMKVLENTDEFRCFSNRLLEDQSHFVCQEYIKGEDNKCKFYIFYRNQKGNVVECMGEKTLQDDGIMAIGTTEFDEVLAKSCRLFVEKIDYVGIGGIEVKLHNGKYYFIEMSTRTEGFVAISDMAGVSLSEAAFLDKNGMAFPDNRQIDGVRYVAPLLFIHNRIHRKQYFRLFSEVSAIAFDKKAHFVSRFLGTRLLDNYHKR